MTTVSCGPETLDKDAREAVVRDAVRRIRADVMLKHLSTFPQHRLTEWCRKAESGLLMWVAGDDAATVDRIYYELGSIGAASQVPVRELIRALILVLNLGRRCLYPHSSMPTSPDSSDPLAPFFDYARYYLIRGFEDARR